MHYHRLVDLFPDTILVQAQSVFLCKSCGNLFVRRYLPMYCNQPTLGDLIMNVLNVTPDLVIVNGGSIGMRKW